MNSGMALSAFGLVELVLPCLLQVLRLMAGGPALQFAVGGVFESLKGMGRADAHTRQGSESPDTIDCNPLESISHDNAFFKSELTCFHYMKLFQPKQKEWGRHRIKFFS